MLGAYAAGAPVTAVTAAGLGGYALGTAIDRAGLNPLRFLGDALGPDANRYSSKRLNLDAEIRQGARQKLQPAPGSTVPTLTAGTSNSNRRAEANRMSQQGGGGSTQSRPTAAQPTSRSAHAGGWTPETQGAAYAAGKAMEDDRLSNQAAGLPALWGDVRPDSDPRSESYWQRADMQQWASANLELANRSRSRYNLPPLERGADGKVIVSGGTVSPYANAFSAPVPAELRGRSVQDLYGQQRDPLVDYRSGVSVTPEQFAGGDAAPAAAYSAPMMSTSFNRQQGAQPVNPANVPVAQAFGGNASLAPAGFESSVQVDPSTWSRGADQAVDAYDAELDPSNEFLKRFRARAQ